MNSQMCPSLPILPAFFCSTLVSNFEYPRTLVCLLLSLPDEDKKGRKRLYMLQYFFSSCVCILDNVSCMVCMFVERAKDYCLLFFSVSCWECLSLDVVSLFVERCCFLLFVDCMYIYHILNKNVSLYFCTDCTAVLLVLCSAVNV